MVLAMLAPGSQVVPAHDGRRPVAGGIEPFDRPVVLVDDRAAVFVGHETSTGADVTGHDLHGVVRRLVDRAQAGVHRRLGSPRARL